MTSEIVVNHPIPVELDSLLKEQGYAAKRREPTFTTYEGEATTAPATPSLRSLAVAPRRAAEILEVGHDLIYRLLYEGRIRSVKIGRRRLIPVTELQRFLDEEAT